MSLPLRIPALGDDYKLHMTPIGYDKTKNLEYEQWYFGTYQCVSWVSLKVNQMWGTATDFSNKMFGNAGNLGHAKDWLGVLTKHGYIADSNPKAGDVIWFPANAKVNNRIFSYVLGHVGFVHSVDGSSITWSEYHGGNKNSYKEKTFSLDQLPSSTRFIHVQKKLR